MEKSTKFEGMKISYTTSNLRDSKVLCFIHGWTCSSELWVHQERLLQYPSILMDLPGHGKSDKPDIDYSCDLFARSIKTVLDAEGVSSVTLIGHSLGGVVCTTFMRMYPSMVAGIVYVSAFWMLPSHYIGQQERQELKASLRDDNNFLAMFAAYDLDERCKQVMLATPVHVRLSAGCTDSLPRHWRWDEDYSIPALHLTSTIDAAWDKASLHHLPLLRTQRWPVKGHFLFMTESERFNGTVEEFLLDCLLVDEIR